MDEVKKDPPTLNTIPEDVFGKLLERMDYKSIFTLRQVCRSIHDYIDDNKPDIRLNRLALDHRSDYDFLRINGIPKKSSPEKRTEILLKILKFQKSELNYLALYLTSCTCIEEYFEKLIGVLKNRPLRVHEFHFIFSEDKYVSKILPFFDSRHLRVIEIGSKDEKSEYFDLEPIIGMEQWKNAKVLKLHKKVNLELRHFLHFDCVQIMRDTITLDDVKILKELFLQSPHKGNFTISLKRWTEQREIMNYLGAPGKSVPQGLYHKWLCDVQHPQKALIIQICGISIEEDERRTVHCSVQFWSTSIPMARHFMNR